MKSISDDDLCSNCAHCTYVQEADRHACAHDFPGVTDDDDYVIRCVHFTLYACGANEANDRAEMVIEGIHPWITYNAVREAYGLDDSFVWTAASLSPYVEQYLKEHQG